MKLGPPFSDRLCPELIHLILREQNLQPAKKLQHLKSAEKRGAGLVSTARCGCPSAVKVISCTTAGEGTHGDSDSAPALVAHRLVRFGTPTATRWNLL
jgi:hypothetical protein